MQHKIIKLTVIFFILFSLQGFSQTTEKSEHPLLDKYYPQLGDADTAKTVAPEIKPVAQKPVVAPVALPAVTTATPIKPAPAPSVATGPVMAATPPVTTVDTSAIVTNKPAITTPKPPVQKTVAKPVAPPYRDTRLGSSTKKYDTWEKNNNGAGSVTTSPKQ